MVEPVEDVDFFRINRVRYELHVEGTIFITADEECDDFNVDAHRVDLGTPMVIGQTVLHSVERCIDDPLKPFDRAAWVAEHNPYRQPESETTLGGIT